MFDWGILKRGVPKSVRFCIGDLPMFTFFIPTHPYLKVLITHLLLVIEVWDGNQPIENHGLGIFLCGQI